MYLGEKASLKQKTPLRLHKICIKIIKYQKTDSHHQHKTGEAGRTGPVQLERERLRLLQNSFPPGRRKSPRLGAQAFY